MDKQTYPEKIAPAIKWNHIDGPLLTCSDGTLHWLTVQERLWMKFGFTNIDQLNDKYSHEACRG